MKHERTSVVKGGLNAGKTAEMLANARETRRFEVLNVLVGHCGEQLTPANVDAIAAELVKAMETGPCSWAFGLLTLKP